MEPTAPASTGRGEGDARRFARERMLDPINLILIPNLVILTVAHRYELIANEPLWLVLGALVLVHASAVAFATCFPPGSSRARPTSFLALTTGLGGLFIYVTGWGAVLAVALVAPATVVIDADGSRYGRAAMLAIAVTIVAGEGAVAVGIFETMIPEGTAHGIALFEAMVTMMVVGLVARGQRDKELAEAREKAGEERFRALVQYASDAIVVVADGGRVLYASPAVQHILGCAPEALESFDIDWIDSDHTDAITEVWRRLRAQPGASKSVEVPVRRADGTSRWVEVHLTNLVDNPAVGGFVCNMRDIGERRVAQMQLVHDALHDPLTGLPNRRCFLERLDEVWRAATPDDLIAVLFVDVDNFKQVNDAYSHATGDGALVVVANTISKLVRPNDLVGRFGGDEFTVLLQGLHDVDGALEIAERITRELSNAWDVNGHNVHLSVSVGVSASFGKAKSTDELVRDADRAMYQAKRNGRARWESFDQPRTNARSEAEARIGSAR